MSKVRNINFFLQITKFYKIINENIEKGTIFVLSCAVYIIYICVPSTFHPLIPFCDTQCQLTTRLVIGKPR